VIRRTFEVESAFDDPVVFTIRSIQLYPHPNSGSEFHSTAVSISADIHYPPESKSESVLNNWNRMRSVMSCKTFDAHKTADASKHPDREFVEEFEMMEKKKNLKMAPLQLSTRTRSPIFSIIVRSIALPATLSNANLKSLFNAVACFDNVSLESSSFICVMISSMWGTCSYFDTSGMQSENDSLILHSISTIFPDSTPGDYWLLMTAIGSIPKGVRARLSFSLRFAPNWTRTLALLSAKLAAAICRALPFSCSLHAVSMSTQPVQHQSVTLNQSRIPWCLIAIN